MKRADSQIKAFLNLFESEIRVELICEALYVVEADTDAIETARDLLSKGYDECGVRRDSSVTEIVNRSDLVNDTVGMHAQNVPLERLVAPATPLWSCLSRIACHNSLFVLGDHGIDGIVTAADLDKQPARLLMFGLVSMLEMVLLALVRKHHVDDGWQELLTVKRLDDAQDLFQKRRDADQEIDLIECIQLCDKVDICLKTEDLTAALGISKKRGKRMFNSLEEIRNNLAHAQSAASKGRPWSEIVESLQQGHEFLDRVAKLLAANSETAN